MQAGGYRQRRSTRRQGKVKLAAVAVRGGSQGGGERRKERRNGGTACRAHTWREGGGGQVTHYLQIRIIVACSWAARHGLEGRGR